MAYILARLRQLLLRATFWCVKAAVSLFYESSDQNVFPAVIFWRQSLCSHHRFRGKGKCRPFHWLSCNTAQYTVCMFRWPRPLSIWFLYFALIEQGRGLWAQFMPAAEVRFHRWANLLKYSCYQSLIFELTFLILALLLWTKNYWPPRTDESQGKRRHLPFPLLFIAPYLL